MPPQIAPALFRLLLEEHQSAQDPAFQFDTIVYVTKVYHEVPAQESSETTTTTKKDRPRKKVKKSALSEFYFNVEDQVLQQVSFSFLVLLETYFHGSGLVFLKRRPVRFHVL